MGEVARRLIVNADDFGLTAGVSGGILRAHREGVVTSTTVLASLPPQVTLAVEDYNRLARMCRQGEKLKIACDLAVEPRHGEPATMRSHRFTGQRQGQIAGFSGRQTVEPAHHFALIGSR